MNFGEPPFVLSDWGYNQQFVRMTMSLHHTRTPYSGVDEFVAALAA